MSSKQRKKEKKITVVNYPFRQVEKPNSLKQTRTHDNSSQQQLTVSTPVGFLQYARNEKPEDR